MFDKSMNFALGEDIDALREMVHRFARERIAPRAAEIDASNEFPNELWREMGVPSGVCQSAWPCSLAPWHVAHFSA